MKTNKGLNKPSTIRTPRRSKNARKKHKMNTRAKLRFFQRRRIAERKRKSGTVNIQCNTRTVEFPETANIGDEKSKLLFMLAIGLVPNPGADTKCKAGPSVKLERLDPVIETKARTRTKQVIMEIFKSRQAQLLSQRNLEPQCRPFQSLHRNTSLRPYCSNPLPSANSNEVEVVDLVSSDDEGPELTEAAWEKAPDFSSRGSLTGRGRPATSKRLARKHIASGSFKKVNSSSHVRKSVFKPLNIQEGGECINWMPESRMRKTDLKTLEAAKSSNVPSLKRSRSQPSFLYSFKSKPSSGGTSKRHVRGTNGDESSWLSVLEEADCIPSAIIIID